MPNTINAIIASLSRQEYRDLKLYCSSGRYAEREDVKLLEVIRTGRNSSGKNSNAVHQTRKRLKKTVEQFIIKKCVQQDIQFRIYSFMEIAKHLFRKNMYREAWDYLLKAEALAIEAEEYNLLDHNYYIQITYCHNEAAHPQSDFSVERLLEKRAENKLLADIESNAKAAYAFLVNELNKQFSEQLVVNVDQLTQDILKQFGLNEKLYDNKLRIYSKIVTLVCRVLREKREYTNLKNYAINSYKLIRKNKEIHNLSDEFLIDLLDAICVGTLRSKDYKNCEKYTRLYEVQAKKMIAHSGRYTFYDFIQYVGVCDLSLCTNQLALAKETMLAAKKKYMNSTYIRISFLLRINLIAVHFCCREYAACIKLYNEIRSLNEKEILAEPGFRLELILFSDIYAIIFHYEEKEEEFALYLLEKFKRKYKTFLSQPDLKREKIFIELLEGILKNRQYLSTEANKIKTRKYIALRTYIPGDFEYISMNAWLQSKLSGKSYYESFLQLV